jgi:hypothetical protein
VTLRLFGIFFTARDFRKRINEKHTDAALIMRKTDSGAENATLNWNVPINPIGAGR